MRKEEQIERHFGIVTRIPEDPDSRGAVYFKSPTLTGATEYPIPAQPSFPLAGKDGEGFFWVPQINDLIEIEINAADEHPVPKYIRMSYNSEDDVNNYFKQDYPYAKGLASRSGHILMMSDKPGEERVYLFSGGGHKILLDDTKGKESLFFIHKNGSQIQIGEDGSVRIFSNSGGTASALIFDATSGAVTTISRAGAVVALTDKISISDPKGEAKVDLADGKVQVSAVKNVVIQTPSLNLVGGVTKIGNQAIYSAVVGENLIAYNDVHTHMTAVGPSGPPIIPMITLTGSPASIITPWVKLQKPL